LTGLFSFSPPLVLLLVNRSFPSPSSSSPWLEWRVVTDRPPTKTHRSWWPSIVGLIIESVCPVANRPLSIGRAPDNPSSNGCPKGHGHPSTPSVCVFFSRCMAARYHTIRSCSWHVRASHKVVRSRDPKDTNPACRGLIHTLLDADTPSLAAGPVACLQCSFQRALVPFGLQRIVASSVKAVAGFAQLPPIPFSVVSFGKGLERDEVELVKLDLKTSNLELGQHWRLHPFHFLKTRHRIDLQSFPHPFTTLLPENLAGVENLGPGQARINTRAELQMSKAMAASDHKHPPVSPSFLHTDHGRYFPYAVLAGLRASCSEQKFTTAPALRPFTSRGKILLTTIHQSGIERRQAKLQKLECQAESGHGRARGRRIEVS
ncbi:hypothetical protein CT0861_01886, partial [Colletotrichum tofieldiae]